METISSELLNALELFLNDRVRVTLDGEPNEAMELLIRLQAERDKWDDDQPLDHNGEPF